MAQFHSWYQTIMLGFVGNATQRAEAFGAVRSFSDYCIPIIAERRDDPGDDFISRIIHAEAGGQKLTDTEVCSFLSAMRHSFPVTHQVRLTTQDVEWHGTTVPSGSSVQLTIGSANYDETIFANPARFDIDRADLWKAKELRSGHAQNDVFGQLAFGLGKHFCPGYFYKYALLMPMRVFSGDRATWPFNPFNWQVLPSPCESGP
jgi:cytochrome P450